ncbi:MAG: NADH-quinone oxidoreductase subunit I [Bacteroidaceae bacterium]|nr:NADH-quinone oxidoreductase subunit I [Bacteroidaceae bacterium]MBR6750037.1 NADH-quinone oxidoreductase subunit I [Bacteroidaceae bacterium]
MGSNKNYFTSLFEGIGSLLTGMSITGKYFFSRKITQQYPENRKTLEIPERFRATLSLVYDEQGNHKCIACGICQNNCPNNTIEVVAKKIETEDGKTKRVLDRYMYDLGCCTFCQLCVSTCPHNAIEFTNEFEQAVFSREKLVKQLNNRPEPVRETPKEEKSE